VKKIYLINYLNAGPHFSLMQIQAGPVEIVPKIFRFFKHVECMDYAIKIFKTQVEKENNLIKLLVATLIIPSKVVPESKLERVNF